LKKSNPKIWYRTAVNAFCFIQGLIFASWASRIPEIKEFLGMNDAQFGGILFCLPLGEICFMIPIGYLVSRFGSKRMLVLGALLYPLMLVFVGLAPSALYISAILVLFGAAGSLTNIAVNTQAVGVERLYRRSIMGSFHGLWSLAGFSGGLIGALMVALDITPQIHFIIIFAATTVVAICMQGCALPRDCRPKNFEATRHKIFTRPDHYILLLGLIAMSGSICEGAVFDWTNIYFGDVLNVPQNFVRFGYIAAMGSMTLGRFTVDRFIIHFGAIRVLQFSGFLLVTGLCCAVSFLHIVPSTFGFLLIGAGMSPVIPICYSLTGRSKGMLPGIAITAVSTIGFLGFLAGPPMIGFISHAISLRWALCVIAAVGTLILLLSATLRKFIPKRTFDNE
jgi:MFS family permease